MRLKGTAVLLAGVCLLCGCGRESRRPAGELGSGLTSSNTPSPGAASNLGADDSRATMGIGTGKPRYQPGGGEWWTKEQSQKSREHARPEAERPGLHPEKP